MLGRSVSIGRAFAIYPLVAFVAAVALAASFVHGGAVTYTDVADSSTVIPAGAFAGQHFQSFTTNGIVTPPVINQGHVLFIGPPSTNGNQWAAFTWSGDGLHLLADASVPIPGRPTQTFGELRYPSTEGGQYAFSSGDGIYATVGGVLTKVIDPSSGFAGSSAPALDGPNVWFFGEKPQDGVFRWNNGTLTQVAAVGTSTPSAPGYQFNGFNSNVAASRNSVAFYGTSRLTVGQGSLAGIYSFSNGMITRIADSAMTAPGGTAQFGGFSNIAISYDGRHAAFLGGGQQTSVYLASDGQIQVLAGNGGAAPGGGTFNLTQGNTGYSVDGENAALSDDTAIYFKPGGGPLQRLIGRGDVLNGSTIADVGISTEALSGDQLAFWADFNNGSSGIFVATIPSIPEPTTASLVLTGLCGPLLLRRRRR